MAKRPINTYLITIIILAKEWDYEIGQEVIVPVNATSPLNARKKFEKKHWGGEYPPIEMKRIDLTDWLFKPIL